MSKKTEVLALTYARLKAQGFKVSLNHRMKLGIVAPGFKTVMIDLALLDKGNNPILLVYIGPEKARRIIKYRMLKLPIIYIKGEEDLQEGLAKVTKWVVNNLYP